MKQAAAADADRGRRPAAPPQLDAAAYNIGGVRSGRDVEQQPREDKEPEFVNAERLSHYFLQIPSLPSFPASPMQDIWSLKGPNPARIVLLLCPDRASAT